METVIFCGGLGTRMREETEWRPKPMVYVGDRPIIWHIMKIYAHYGHTEFILTLGYKGDIIKDYFYNYEIMNNDVTLELGRPENLTLYQGHEEIGWKITLANTGEKTLKGGRLKRVQKYVKGDMFMITYGDGIADVNINALIDFHRAHGKMATVTGVRPIARFGELSIEGQRVSSFLEKPQITKEAFINGGFFVFNRDIFGLLSEDEDCDLEYGVLEKLALKGELMVYRHDGFWHCMDTIRDLEVLSKLWKSGTPPWKLWP